MAERPIIFSGPMVRAILADRKFQTRRVLEPQPRHRANLLRIVGPSAIFCDGDHEKNEDCEEHKYSVRIRYAKGDVLWVREATVQTPAGLAYVADGAEHYGAGGALRKRPAIHMPREFSRITLRVTDVRVQRLQDISEEDAKAEGVEFSAPTPEDEEWNRQWCEEHGYPVEPLEGVWLAPGTRQGYGPRRNDPQWGPTPQFAYRLLWDAINAKRGHPWESNPWVAAISFERADNG